MRAHCRPRSDTSTRSIYQQIIILLLSSHPALVFRLLCDSSACIRGLAFTYSALAAFGQVWHTDILDSSTVLSILNYQQLLSESFRSINQHYSTTLNTSTSVIMAKFDELGCPEAATLQLAHTKFNRINNHTTIFTDNEQPDEIRPASENKADGVDERDDTSDALGLQKNSYYGDVKTGPA